MTTLAPAVRLLAGLGDVDGARYDELVGSAPVTARWHWLSTWARTHPGWHVLAVVALDETGGLDAAALLAHRRRGLVHDVTALGHGQSDYARFPARTSAAAGVLVDGVCAAIRTLPWPRRIRLDGFPPRDEVLQGLSRRLPGAVLLDGDGAPTIPLVAGDDPLTGRREARVMARRGHNRLRTDGRELQLAATSCASEVAALLPQLRRLHATRDAQVRGFSDLDDQENLEFWSAVCVESAQRGELELSTMRVDGQLAAYVIAFRDGRSYRVWDPRISPEHTRYNPGHVLRADVLARVVAAGTFDEFDWMRGVERYKLATTSHVVHTQRILAWSPGWVHRVEPALRDLHGQLTRRSAHAAAPSEAVAAPVGPAPNTTLPPAPPRSAVLAELVDSAARGPVLVVGSVPPEGRDLDLLVPDAQLADLTAALEAAGFACHGGSWLRWAHADDRLRADVVDVLALDSWGLDVDEQAWVWAQARGLPGRRRLSRPAPAASLLILARRYADADAHLGHSWAARIAAELRHDPRAWDVAAAHAPAWRAAAALAALREHASGAAPSLAARYRVAREQPSAARKPLGALRAARRAVATPARKQHPAVVTISGLDGAGKTSQTALLVSALHDLGISAAPGWFRMSYRTWMWTLDRWIVALVRVARNAPEACHRPNAQPDRPHRALRERHPALTWAWAWVVTLDAVVAQRSLLHTGQEVDVVVCDRYALDSAVHLWAQYGATIDVGRHAATLRALLPRPLAAFLLRLDAGEAHVRKSDEHAVHQLQRQAALYDRHVDSHRPITVLDANRPPGELAEQIAEHVRAAWVVRNLGAPRRRPARCRR